MDIKIIENQELKSTITDHILHQLPHWFGIESSTMEYVQGVKDKVFFAVYEGDNVVGFLSLKFHNAYTAELYVLGILEEYHRHGIGKQLVDAAEQYIKNLGYTLLMVKTLGESNSDMYYGRTRQFYTSVGFYPLEELKEIWDEENPCLIMVKPLKQTRKNCLEDEIEFANRINIEINEAKKNGISPKYISDRHHTFDELYRHRHALFINLALAFKKLQKHTVWRSKQHLDGTMFNNLFIMGIGIEEGEQITYHLPLEYWDVTGFALTLEFAPKWDGHSSLDVIERLMSLIQVEIEEE